MERNHLGALVQDLLVGQEDGKANQCCLCLEPVDLDESFVLVVGMVVVADSVELVLCSMPDEGPGCLPDATSDNSSSPSPGNGPA